MKKVNFVEEAVDHGQGHHGAADALSVDHTALEVVEGGDPAQDHRERECAQDPAGAAARQLGPEDRQCKHERCGKKAAAHEIAPDF